MADMTIACPHCSQRITCDELWGGHTLQCPTCHKELAVPAPAPAEAPPTEPALVPKVPQGPPRLVMGPKPSALDPAGPRAVPIRNLAPPPPKKKNPALQIVTVVLVLVVLGVAAYFAYPYVKGMLQKTSAGSSNEGQTSSGGGSAPLQEVNAAMDIADSSSGSSTPSQPSSRKAAKPPSGPPVWTLDIAAANIPESPVSGSVSGSQFALETARFDVIGGAQVLRLLQGLPTVPDRELSIYLVLKPGETLGGQTLSISPAAKAAEMPQQIIKRWKVGNGPGLQMKAFPAGYALKLTLEQPGADGLIPGKIFLALPDTEQTFVAGTFKATVGQSQAPTAPAASAPAPGSPQARPTPLSPDAKKRYGL
jgi:hypothetical protein